MASAEVVRPYIEQKIAQTLGVEELKKDPNGDIPVRHGSIFYIVRLVDGPSGAILRVFSPLLGEIESTAELLERLNEYNVASPFVRFFWTNNQVFCSTDLIAENLQDEEIRNALLAVAWHADNVDDHLQKEFGGKQMFEDETAAKPDTSGSPGGYL